jgi:hypothetical protein
MRKRGFRQDYYKPFISARYLTWKPLLHVLRWYMLRSQEALPEVLPSKKLR